MYAEPHYIPDDKFATQLLNSMFKTMAENNCNPRIYPPDPPLKTELVNYDPVLKLYYHKVTETQIRDPQKVFAGIYGGMGVLILILINLSSRLCMRACYQDVLQHV